MRQNFRESLCGHPECRERNRIGLDTRPRVHTVTTHGRDLIPGGGYVTHPFVMGGGNAP